VSPALPERQLLLRIQRKGLSLGQKKAGREIDLKTRVKEQTCAYNLKIAKKDLKTKSLGHKSETFFIKILG
jgi:hypothetical protein